LRAVLRTVFRAAAAVFEVFLFFAAIVHPSFGLAAVNSL
jgi:hypothetical protein